MSTVVALPGSNHWNAVILQHRKCVGVTGQPQHSIMCVCVSGGACIWQRSGEAMQNSCQCVIITGAVLHVYNTHSDTLYYSTHLIGITTQGIYDTTIKGSEGDTANVCMCVCECVYKGKKECEEMAN